MFSQAIFKYSDFDSNSNSNSNFNFNFNFNSNSGYDSDNSSNSSNSSNYTITSDPNNHYRKDVLKLNYIQSLSRREQQTQIYLELRRNKVKYNKNRNNLDESDSNSNIIICREIGYDSGFNKNTPLINYLINKRIKFCELGASSHIAAFFPDTNNYRYCFIRDWKGKGHYG